MDIDPITDSDEVAVMCYEDLIGSEFEKVNGWHVNLMPDTVLRDLPAGWQTRATVIAIEKLTLTVPAVVDLLASKLKRNEPRDRAHAEWARTIGLLD